MKRRKGLTLMELLIVMAITTVLLGLILVIVGEVRSRTYMTQCMSNLRQIGLALRMYAQDWGGFAPPYSTEWRARSQASQLVAALNPYLKNEAVWFCPLDPWLKWDGKRLQGKSGATSYLVLLRYSVMPIPLDSPPELLLVDLLPPWYSSDPVARERRLKCPLCRALVRDFWRWVYAYCPEHDRNIYLLVNGRVIARYYSFPHSSPAPVPKDWPFGDIP